MYFSLVILWSLVSADPLDLPATLELLECKGTSTLECCSQFVWYVMSSKGKTGTSFVPYQDQYISQRTFKESYNGDGYEFGCSTLKYLYGQEDEETGLGEVWPLYMTCKPGEILYKSYETGNDGRCLDPTKYEQPVDWDAIRKSTQVVENGVPRIQSLYTQFIAFVASRRAWRKQEILNTIMAKQVWDDFYELPGRTTRKDCAPKCAGNKSWEMKCFDLFTSTDSSLRAYDSVAEKKDCRYESCK